MGDSQSEKSKKERKHLKMIRTLKFRLRCALLIRVGYLDNTDGQGVKKKGTRLTAHALVYKAEVTKAPINLGGRSDRAIATRYVRYEELQSFAVHKQKGSLPHSIIGASAALPASGHAEQLHSNTVCTLG